LRFAVLDSWRGVAATFVALFHLAALNHFHMIPLVANSFLFVDFFFVLSGFVITHAYGARLSTPVEATGYAIRRFGRVWPLHAAVLAMFVGVEAMKLVLESVTGLRAGTPAFGEGGFTPLSAIPSHLALTQGLGFHDGLTWNMPSWSISAEFWVYLVFAVVSVLFPARRVLVMMGLAAVSAAVIAACSKRGIYVTYDLGLLRCLAGFAAGHVAYAMRQSFETAPWRQSARIEWLTLGGIAAFVSLAGTGPLSLTAPLVFATAVLVFSYESGPVSRLLETPPFRRLGDWSYSIYMVHGLIAFVIGLASGVVQKLFGVEMWREMAIAGSEQRALVFGGPFLLDAVALLYLGLVLLMASQTYRWIEVPARRYFASLADAWEERSGPAGAAAIGGLGKTG